MILHIPGDVNKHHHSGKEQPFDELLKQQLSDLVFNKVVAMKWIKLDRYKSVLGKVLVSGQDASFDQIETGLALQEV